jgi:hypothetical protein
MLVDISERFLPFFYGIRPHDSGTIALFVRINLPDKIRFHDVTLLDIHNLAANFQPAMSEEDLVGVLTSHYPIAM